MSATVAAYLTHLSYVGLFVVLALCGLGLPIPEEVALLAGGFMVHRGVMRWPLALAVSLAGVLAGDGSLFLLGRRFGTGLVDYIGGRGSRQYVARMKDFMARHGHLAILYARFLAGVRALVYLTAGSLGVSPGRFFWYDCLGAMVSVPVTLALGYFLGGQLDRGLRYVGGFEKLAWALIALACAAWVARLVVARRAQQKAG